MTSRATTILRTMFGLVLFSVGLYLAVFDIHITISKGLSPHYFTIVFASMLMFAGGYVMTPSVADAIATRVARFLDPLLDRIPGGRRRTDPPAPGPADPLEEPPPGERFEDDPNHQLPGRL